MYSSIDTVWVLICAVLVFMMQAGFAMLETGFIRTKNTGNIIMKNVMDFCIGVICFWFIGFGIMHGTAVKGFIGIPDLFVRGDYGSNIPSLVYVVFQVFFCATAATIVSGAMAERTAFKAYVLYSVIISAFVYPLIGCWIWNDGGWLAKMGFHDLAGGTAVHVVGGISGLMGAALLGPRLGKYKKGKSQAIPGHSLPLAAIGVFFLWIGWFGFNGGSLLGATGDEVLKGLGNIVLNTTLSSASCAVTTMSITWIRYGKSDVSMTLNSVIAGLVAITAGADVVESHAAVIIGILASFVVVFGIEFIDHFLHIDDPVGAVSVHGLCGAFGTIMVGLFSKTDGVFYAGTFNFLGVQCLGVLVVIVAVGLIMGLVFLVMKKTIGIRVSFDEEVKGLDKTQHGLSNSYMDFINSSLQEFESYSGRTDAKAMVVDRKTILDPSAYKADGKMRKVVVVMNASKFEMLKDALDEIEITGMTVTQVNGCGIQKGNTEYYRGAEHASHLLPKVKVEIVIYTVPLALLIDTIKRTLYTGNIGDGKIFVYEVDRVVKIRTDEEGKLALE
ncbi:MAG: ammonium transporter [Eubacterium sp.]|nr:ammonium transporter [Eubacterium sp.]